MFFPIFIALKIFNHLNQNKLKLSDLIIFYFIFNSIINLILYAINVYIFSNDVIAFTSTFTVKYLLLSIVLSTIIPIPIHILFKKFSIKINNIN